MITLHSFAGTAPGKLQIVYKLLRLSELNSDKLEEKKAWLFPVMYMAHPENNKPVPGVSLQGIGIDGNEMEVTSGFNNLLSFIKNNSFGSEYKINDPKAYDLWQQKVGKRSLNYAKENIDATQPRSVESIGDSALYYKALCMYEEAKASLDRIGVNSHETESTAGIGSEELKQELEKSFLASYKPQTDYAKISRDANVELPGQITDRTPASTLSHDQLKALRVLNGVEIVKSN